jgi:hypothetical protein
MDYSDEKSEDDTSTDWMHPVVGTSTHSMRPVGRLRSLLRITHVITVATVLLALWFMFMLGIASLNLLFINSVEYVYKAYLQRDTDHSMSSFFMPCSPQSIKDEDRVWSVFAGLFSLLACEVIIPVYKEFQRRRPREEKTFVDSVESAIRQGQGGRYTSGADDVVELTDLRRRETGP